MKTIPHTPGPIARQGQGTLLHPVTGSPVTLERFETSLGTFEVFDQTNEPDGNAGRILDTWNACAGLDLPAGVKPGALADLVTAARSLVEAYQSRGYGVGDECEEVELALQNLAPVSPQPLNPEFS